MEKHENQPRGDSFAASPGSATLGELIEDYRREKRQYEACSGTDVFAKKRGHRDGMKTIAIKIADLLDASELSTSVR